MSESPAPYASAAVLRFIVQRLLLLTVALLGGMRVAAGDRALVFVPPPLVTLLLATLLMSLFMKGRLVLPRRWLRADLPLLTNVSHVLTLAALFFASAQAFNSVLPEKGLLFWIFSLFFLWTLWNDQFAPFDTPRLLRSLAVLFFTAFVLKHVLLGVFSTPQPGWGRRLAEALLEGVSLGSFEVTAFAPATGYISFFTLALYVLGLALLPPSPEPARMSALQAALESSRRLLPGERRALLAALAERDVVEGELLEGGAEEAQEGPEKRP